MIIYSAPESGGSLDSRQFPLGQACVGGWGCGHLKRWHLGWEDSNSWGWMRWGPSGIGVTWPPRGDGYKLKHTPFPPPQASALQWRPTKGLSKVASPASPILPLPSERQPRPSEQRVPGKSAHSAEHLLQVGTAPSVLAKLPTRERSRLLHHRMKQLKLEEEGTF